MNNYIEFRVDFKLFNTTQVLEGALKTQIEQRGSAPPGPFE